MNRSIIIALLATLVSTGVAANPPVRVDVDSTQLGQLIYAFCDSGTDVQMQKMGIENTPENRTEVLRGCISGSLEMLDATVIK